MKLRNAIRNLWHFRGRNEVLQVGEALAAKVAAHLPNQVRRQVIVQATNRAAVRRTMMTGNTYAGPDGLGYKEIYEGAHR